MNAGECNDVRLSDAARQRRDAILADALRAADGRRRARVARRVAAASSACVLALGAFAIYSRVARPPVGPTPVVEVVPRPTSVPAPPIARPSTAPDAPRVIVQIIPADHVERRWQVINDDQLIAALAAAGKPGGVASLNGKSVIVPLQ